jgi:hypothetical protein
VLDREPNDSLANDYLALCYGFWGRFEDTSQHLSAASLHPGVKQTDGAWLELRRGDARPARSVYANLRGQTAQGKLGPSAPVLLAASTGDLDGAFSLLEQCLRERSVELSSLQADPRLEPLRGDPRSASVVQLVMAGGR